MHKNMRDVASLRRSRRESGEQQRERACERELEKRTKTLAQKKKRSSRRRRIWKNIQRRIQKADKTHNCNAPRVTHTQRSDVSSSVAAVAATEMTTSNYAAADACAVRGCSANNESADDPLTEATDRATQRRLRRPTTTQSVSAARRNETRASARRSEARAWVRRGRGRDDVRLDSTRRVDACLPACLCLAQSALSLSRQPLLHAGQQQHALLQWLRRRRR